MSTTNRIIFVGAPGSGKGTQAQRLLDRYGTPQISTGDILRQARKEGTSLGKEAQKYMDQGKLVPDDLIIDLIKDTLGKGGFDKGWVLDGFPRTLAQAEALDRMLSARGEKVTSVLFIDVPAAVLIERIVGRRSCPSCGNVHHIKFHPPKVAGVCDKCGTALVQRADDTEEKAKVRQAAFEADTAAVIPYYERQKLVTRIDGLQAPDEVFSRIEKALGARN
ncbi:MAG: adenylate kinase [Myxococcota bacterium]